jgi:hypothetical protein
MSSLIVILICAGIVWASVNFMNKITDELNPPSVIKKVLLGLPIVIGIAVLVWLYSIGFVPGWFVAICQIFLIFA